MGEVFFRDKVGHTEQLPASPGQPLTDVLRRAGIPVNAVLTRRNGQLVSEQTTVVGPDDVIQVSQVRHYDLGVTRRPSRQVYGVPDPVYTKAVMFDTEGSMEHRLEQFDADGFVAYIEETFVQSILSQQVLRPGDDIVVGLSGGRDSVSYLKLLERCGHRLPTVRQTAVTIVGLPDWEEPATFEAAQAVGRSIGVEHVIVTPEEVEQIFKLRRPFAEAMNSVVAGESSHLNMVIGHMVLRRMLENEAHRRGVSTIAWGFNADDLVASLVTWYTSGFRMGGIPIRHIGDLRYVFPIYRITKKELTLYLELVAPELNRQGTPGRFTTGTDERSMAYAITDHLYDLWPGIDYYLFSAFGEMQRYMFPTVERTCRTCAGIYLVQEGMPNPADLCDVCEFFARQEMVVGG